MSKLGAVSVNGREVLSNVTYCDQFLCKFQGLMFRKQLADGEALIMAEKRPSKTGTSIHMLFVFMSLTVLWLDEDFKVVDKKLAKPWRLAYFPKQAAKYILETSTDSYDSFDLGDRLDFKPH